MNLTITLNSAVDVNPTLSGNLAVTDDGKTGLTLGAKVTYTSSGAVYTSSSVAYDGTSTSTFSFSNGTSLSINQSTGDFTFNRLTTEYTDGVVDTYAFQFTLSDGTTTVSDTKSITTQQNITISNFTASATNDATSVISGTIDITVLADAGVKIKAGVVGKSFNAGTDKTFSNSTGEYTWTYSDGGVFKVNTATDSWSYTRPLADVGDLVASSYTFTVTIQDAYVTESSTANITTSVTYPPDIATFTVNPASDNDSSITGNLAINDVAGSNIVVSVTKNGFIYTGSSVAYSATSLAWNFSDGGSFTWDTSKNEWSYTRAASSVGNNSSDIYIFSVVATNTVGTDSGNCTVTTVVPKADIKTFSVNTTLDTEKNIVGVLEIDLPTVANNPTIKVDVTRNGTQYASSPIALTTSDAVFTYTDGTKFIYSPESNSFTYQRDNDETEDSTADNYVFDVAVVVNTQTTEASLVAKTLAGRRVYSYTPAYPIHFAAGSTETEATAWPKVILEFERIYRLYNDNMNYYESMFQDINTRMNGLETRMEEVEKSIDDRLSALEASLNAKIESLKKWVEQQIAAKVHTFGNYTYVSGTSGTAPSDGFYIIYANDSKRGHTYFYVNGALVGVGNSGGVDYGQSARTFTVPVKKGDSWAIDSDHFYWIMFFNMV